MNYIFIILLIFYFTPALAIYVKLLDYGSKKYFLKFILSLPYRGYYVIFRVLGGLIAHVYQDKIIKDKSLIQNYYMVIRVWLDYIPMMYASVGLILIENSKAIKNKYKRTSNSYKRDITIDLEKICA